MDGLDLVLCLEIIRFLLFAGPERSESTSDILLFLLSGDEQMVLVIRYGEEELTI